MMCLEIRCWVDNISRHIVRTHSTEELISQVSLEDFYMNWVVTIVPTLLGNFVLVMFR